MQHRKLIETYTQVNAEQQVTACQLTNALCAHAHFWCLLFATGYKHVI